jgi:hypothetical protein
MLYKMVDGFQRFSVIFCYRLQVKEIETLSALRNEVKRYEMLAHLRDVLMRALRRSQLDFAIIHKGEIAH